jgi:hypothetical protein
MSADSAKKITIGRSDVDAAALDGVVTPSQAEALWQRWQAVVQTDHAVSAVSQPIFNMAHVLYYLGGLIAIGAMSLFMTLGFQSLGAGGLLLIAVAYALGCLKVAEYFIQKSYPIPAGILLTLAVCLVPLMVWSIQTLAGWWPLNQNDIPTETYTTYHRYVHWRWLPMELATLLAALVLLWRYRLPFLVLPVAVTLWYMSMDVAHSISLNAFNWALTRQVSLVFGLLTCVVAVVVDVRCRLALQTQWRQDFAFWLYLSGVTMFWLGLSFLDSESEWSKLGYACINLGMIFVGVLLQRRVFTVYGALGFAGYVGYLSHQWFQDSLLFPFALTLLGLGVVYLGLWWQKNEAQLYRRFQSWLPVTLRQAFEAGH